MNRKLNSIKPYIKFYLQHATGQPVKDSDIDIMCNSGEMISVANVGEGYVLVSKTRLQKREDFSEVKNEMGELEKAARLTCEEDS